MESPRAEIERATENLALADAEDIPGVSKLLVGWCGRKPISRTSFDQHGPNVRFKKFGLLPRRRRGRTFRRFVASRKAGDDGRL